MKFGEDEVVGIIHTGFCWQACFCLWLNEGRIHRHCSAPAILSVVMDRKECWAMRSSQYSPLPSLPFPSFLSFSTEVGWIPAQAEELTQQHPIFRPLFDHTSLSSPLCSTRLCSVNYRFGYMCYFMFNPACGGGEKTGFYLPSRLSRMAASVVWGWDYSAKTIKSRKSSLLSVWNLY